MSPYQLIFYIVLAAMFLALIISAFRAWVIMVVVNSIIRTIKEEVRKNGKKI